MDWYRWQRCAPLCLTCALHHGQPDTAEAEYRHRIPSRTFAGIVYRADPGGHAAAEQANLLRMACGLIFASDTSATTVYSLNVEQPI